MRVTRAAGTKVQVLVWEETEHEAANQIARPTRRTIHHFADADIPVFDRAGDSPSWKGARIASY